MYCYNLFYEIRVRIDQIFGINWFNAALVPKNKMTRQQFLWYAWRGLLSCLAGTLIEIKRPAHLSIVKRLGRFSF